MTQDEIRRELRRYLDIHAECERTRERIKEKQKDINDLRKIAFECIVKHDLTIIEQVNQAVEAINELLEHYCQSVVKREAAERSVLQWIDMVDEPSWRRLLFLRFIEGKSEYDVAEELYISTRTLWKWYKKAIEQIERAVNADEISAAGDAGDLPHADSIEAIRRRA